MSGDAEALNAVVLQGRLSAAAQERLLPSGDRLVSFRVIVARDGPAASRQRVDALECVAWGARVRRSVARWDSGDLVRIEGAVRRRFFRGAQGSASRVEVEVSRARLIRRAASA